MSFISVGFIVSNYFPRLGGMQYASHYLADSLNTLKEVSASVATSNMPDIPRTFKYPHPVYRSLKFGHLTPWLFQLNMQRMIRHEKVNVLHGQVLTDGGWQAVLRKRSSGLPVVAASRGSDVQQVPEIQYGDCLKPERRKLVREVFKEADHIIALSTINKTDMVELGCNPDKISVIPNGVLWKEIQQIPFQNLRSCYGLEQDDFVLISVGRNQPVKNLSLLFEGIAKTRNPKVKCICVGPKKDLYALACKIGVEKQLVFTEQIQGKRQGEFPPYRELINLYRSANYYISTSYVECFSNAAIEALASGTPVILGQKHGVRDILTTKNGIVLEKETPDELAELLNELAQNKPRSTTEEIAYSVEHLSWEQIAQQTLQLYKTLV